MWPFAEHNENIHFDIEQDIRTSSKLNEKSDLRLRLGFANRLVILIVCFVFFEKWASRRK